METIDTVESDIQDTGLAERYRVLLEIGRTLTGTLSPEELYGSIYRETAQVLEAGGFYISLYDEGRDLATIVFYADRGEERRVEIRYKGSDSDVMRTGEPSLVEDRASSHSLMVLGDETSELTRSSISAALRYKSRVLGAISVQSYRASAYTEADLELLQAIGDIAAVAVENARFVGELERRRHEAEKIEEIGRALASSLDPQEVLRKVIDAALDLVEADGVTVWLREGGSHVRVAAAGGRIRIPEGEEWDLAGPLFDRLVKERKPVVIDDLAASPEVPSHLRAFLEGGAGMAVPLVVSGETVGALSAGSAQETFFDDDDVHILHRLASQAAVALENARLHSSLQSLSLSDPLTGLANRRHLQIHLEREVAAARRGRALVVCFFDLDNFKGFNDSLGHLAGDDALRAFAQVLADENRAMNLVARYGGDEFVSVLSDSTAEGALYYLRRVDERVAADPVLAPAGITVSCGMAPFDRETMSRPEDLIQAADADLYRRKGQR